MELTHKNTVKYENNNIRIEYECHINNLNDFIKLVDYLEKKYGTIEDILCIKRDENNKLLYYNEYESIDELKNTFDKNRFMEYNTYKFSTRDRYIDFVYDLNNNKLNVDNNEGSLGKKIYDEDKVKYYKDSYGNIVKYDANKGMLYEYDVKTNKWRKNRELTSDFLSYDSEYTLVDYDEHSVEKIR